MKRSDFNRLKKIMDRTRSENDHEALASLRAANRIIESAGVSWERFFDRAVTIEVEDAGAPARPAAGPRRPWSPGDGVEGAAAPRSMPPGFGEDEDPRERPPPRSFHDEPEGHPGDYDEPDADPMPPSERGGPVIDRAAEEQVLRITRAFERLARVGVAEEAKKFVDSLRAQWRRRASLSDKQVAALMKFDATARKREEGR